MPNQDAENQRQPLWGRENRASQGIADTNGKAAATVQSSSFGHQHVRSGRAVCKGGSFSDGGIIGNQVERLRHLIAAQTDLLNQMNEWLIELEALQQSVVDELGNDEEP
ncbi:MAG: hypothetical protein MUF72_10115 [Elainella sp. Prado103]|jgi:hypothetical protein|nr:hypothetical protein [Elainella sp. Prado103]